MNTYREYSHEDLKRLQKCELGILLDVDSICKQYDIPYFLDSGTALGAVRHHGFIPWDDDIDIGMLRSDYERFMTKAAASFNEKYVISSETTNNTQAVMFGKIWIKGTKFETKETLDAGLNQGIFIDVIPYDVLNKNDKIAKRQIRIGKRWQAISYLYHSGNVIIGKRGIIGLVLQLACKIAHILFKLFLNHKVIVAKFRKAVDLGLKDPSDNYVILAYPTKEPFSKTLLFPTRFTEFDNAYLPIPNDVDSYLVIMYGHDWSQLPPVEKRRNHAPEILEFLEE